jgi:phosphatidylserine/phosphatidylglycerophosphate/cardiolipin synthase-like enzyme
VHANGDDALLVWSVDDVIPECRGFAIRRELTHAGQKKATWLNNFMGFRGDPPPADGKPRPSTEWPFQGFFWTDHEVGQGDHARYRVIPVVRGPDGKLARRDNLASEWVDAPEPPPNPKFQAFFNRGFVISQFISRFLKEKGLTLAQFKKTISDEHDQTIRRFLSGDLRLEMLKLVDDARTGGGQVFAALFELGDVELRDSLCALASRAHIVLANGSIQHVKGAHTADERKQDENKDARAKLREAGVDVDVDNRFTSPGPLGHNKFLVFTDAAGNAKTVFTGSTNWTPTGLCTQLNNGLLIDDPAIADIYLKQWQALRKAKNDFPPSLVSGNSQPKPSGDATVWFTRTNGKVDLTALQDEVAAAKHMILFLLFMPGATGVLADLLKRDKEPGLFVRGVVSTLPKGLNDESVVDITIVGEGAPQTHRLHHVIQPQGIDHPIAFWAAEVTRNEFLKNIGFAIVHSKVLVIDPLSDSPTVITGSHNFSGTASTDNDENFIIIKNQPELARAYLVNVIGAWRHYRARANPKKPFPGLLDDASWMPGSLKARQDEAAFWGF